MTPTEQDKELREELYGLLKTDPRADTYVIPYRVMDIIVEFITADRKRVALEAMIDELNNVRSMWTKPGIGDIKFGHWLHYRQKTLVDLSELKAQQET